MRPLLLAVALATVWVGACTTSVQVPFNPAGSPTPCPNPLWTAGFETGDLSEWTQGGGGGTKVVYGSAQIAVTTGTAHTGSYAARVRLKTPPQAGLLLDRSLEPSAHSDLFYTAWYYLPVPTHRTGGYWDLMVWFSSAGTEIFDLGVGYSGTSYVTGYDQLTARNYLQTTVPVPSQQWFRVDAYYDCVPGAGAGKVSVWQDGTLLFSTTAEATALAGQSCLWTTGSTSDGLSPDPGYLYLDDAAIAANCGG